jgi:hypothetical protein
MLLSELRVKSSQVITLPKAKSQAFFSFLSDHIGDFDKYRILKKYHQPWRI